MIASKQCRTSAQRAAWFAATLGLALLAGGVACAGAEAKPGPLAPELGAAAISEEENPLLEIARQMRQVEGLIAETQSGPKTQKLQGEIVARLQELIEQAARAASQPKPADTKTPGTAQRKPVGQPQQKPGAKPGQTAKPAKDPRQRQGGPEARRAGDVGEVLDVLKQRWGELPQRAREQMLQLLPREEFLPKYELLIEQYYKRLAEEKP